MNRTKRLDRSVHNCYTFNAVYTDQMGYCNMSNTQANGIQATSLTDYSGRNSAFIINQRIHVRIYDLLDICSAGMIVVPV